ncbi:MAG TPA: DMT family transporter [Flavobacteriaceae bacterium]|nr:DMT family transporter [Flavobacteriaceae bacterium]MCB9214193.1 DMT family transporter [Alteromonas sp.]HPF12394.1 DMT family transporter [Flavobacteriaceae bacterium]HQU21578.1 DMT family transporter [Flavobacteriaceae bacterium]HQU66391.1 DMT family transporter [Flavobacteriaceae bacterium]
MRNDKLLNYLHLHFIVFIWGFTAVLGALISLEAIPLVWYRMLIATVLVYIFIGFKKISLRFPKKVLLVLLLAGLIIAVHWLTFFGAIKASNVSVTLSVMSTGALFTSFLEPIFFRRKIILYEVAFGIIAALGLYMIFRASAEYVLGIALALISAFLSALMSVINGIYAKRYNASAISFYELGFGVLCITVYLLFEGSFSSDFFRLSASDWIYLGILASVCTAYAYIAAVHVMRWISPFTVMLTINLEPVYGILLALWILGDAEKMGSSFYLGAFIILATVLANGIIKIRQHRKSREMPFG